MIYRSPPIPPDSFPGIARKHHSSSSAASSAISWKGISHSASKGRRPLRKPPASASCAPPPHRPSPSKSPASPSKIPLNSTTWLPALQTPSRVAPPRFVLPTSSPPIRESAHDSALAHLVSRRPRHRRRNRRNLSPDFAPQHPPSREIAAA